MSIGLGSDKFDPLDHSRTLIARHARRAASYADILADLIEMRDDDGANVIRERFVAETRAVNNFFKLLASQLLEQPANDAAAHFDQQPMPDGAAQ